MDEDGKIDMDELSPEAANADDEKVVFRVGKFVFAEKSRH